MKRRNPRITLSVLPARAIYRAVLQFTQQHPLPRTKGRKPLYSEALILTLALLRTAQRASYRQLLFCLAPEALPDQPVPALGTLLYRLQTLADERWHALLSGLAAQGIAHKTPDAPFPTPVVFVDGTGVGFNTPFYAQFRRGAEIRRIRSPLKAVVLVYCRGGRRWVIGASLGRAYADEGRLLAGWLGRYGSGVAGSGALLVGDKLYGYRGRLLARVEQALCVPHTRALRSARRTWAVTAASAMTVSRQSYSGESRATDTPRSAHPSVQNAALPSWGIVPCVYGGRPRVCCNKCIRCATSGWTTARARSSPTTSG